MCQCDDIVTADQICNRECRQNLPKTSFNSDGRIVIYDPVTNTTVMTNLEETGGSAKCALADPSECKLVPIKMVPGDNGNFGADFKLPESIPEDKKFLQQKFKTMSYTGQRFYSWQLDPEREAEMRRKKSPSIEDREYEKEKKKTRQEGDWPWAISDNQRSNRGLAEKDEPKVNEDAKYITNPVICINRGSALLFEGLGENSYPIFEKDSLLNQNEEQFDYGAFDDLSV